MLKKSLFFLFLCSSVFGMDIVIDKTHDTNNIADSLILEDHSKKKEIQNIVIGLLRHPVKKILTDPVALRMWQDDEKAAKKRLSWSEAKAFCKRSEHAGYKNWYLPSMRELEEIVEYTRHTPAIKEGFVHTANYYYWSSSVYAKNTASAWTVNFTLGSTRDDTMDKANNVRCVRRIQKN